MPLTPELEELKRKFIVPARSYPKPYAIEDFEMAWFKCPFGTSRVSSCAGIFSYTEIYDHLGTAHDKSLEFIDELFVRKLHPILAPIPKQYWPHNNHSLSCAAIVRTEEETDD